MVHLKTVHVHEKTGMLGISAKYGKYFMHFGLYDGNNSPDVISNFSIHYRILNALARSQAVGTMGLNEGGIQIDV